MTRLPALLLPFLAATSQAAAPDAATLLAAIAQPAPASTGFFERRESPLLAEPLLLRGLLEQPRAGSLTKAVEWPYVERMSIVDGKVSVERDGERTRRFSLKRAPELVAINAGFEAMLDGDAAALREYFSVDVSGDDAQWRIELTPSSPRLAKKVESMALLGSGNDLRCVDLIQQGGETSRMWVGGVAESAAAAVDNDARDALCGGSPEHIDE
ncbi:MAG: fatty acyl CoA synthetase [Rhodanobacteraceae bacterium]|nr:fatty acyl CoA synthetase [Rhodanobacteraceae bacterium]